MIACDKIMFALFTHLFSGGRSSDMKFLKYDQLYFSLKDYEQISKIPSFF